MPLIDWSTALKVWSMFVHFPHSVTVPKADISTVKEDWRHVESAEGLNVSYTAFGPCVVDCKTYSEQLCDGSKDDGHTVNSVQGIDENCTSEKHTRSHSEDDTKKCADSTDDVTMVGHDIICSETEVSVGVSKESVQAKETTLPSFRATCHRTGEHHCFQSPAAAANFGSAIQDYFGWNVDLDNFDIEVVLCIEDRDIRVGVSLTKQSLHRRHITHFGKTTLRPTIAHGMLR